MDFTFENSVITVSGEDPPPVIPVEALLATAAFGEISLTWTDPNDAAVWANTLISRLNEALRIQAIEDGNNKIYFIREELEKTNTLPTKSTLNFLIEEEIRNIVLANVSKEFAFKIIDPATAPEKKYSPRRTNIVILGFMFGIILGFALIILNNFISKTDFSKN